MSTKRFIFKTGITFHRMFSVKNVESHVFIFLPLYIYVPLVTSKPIETEVLWLEGDQMGAVHGGD